MDGCKPAYVRVSGHLPGTGAEHKFLLTSTIFNDGSALWHADQLLQHLSGNDKLRVGRWFSREGSGIELNILPERTTQEFSLSTVIRLCMWAAGGATKALKQRARPFLQFLLSALLRAGDCTTLPLRLPVPVTDMCTHQSLHVQTSSSTPVDLQTSLFFSYMHFDCVACQSAAGPEVRRIAALVRARAQSGGYASDVGLAVPAYVERGVKRRMDSHACAQRTRIGMEIVVTRHGARQHAGESEQLRSLLATGLTSFQTLHSASVAFDASRMSKPSEETVAFLFQDCSSGVTAWLPVQACLTKQEIPRETS
eukprot:167141-Amphidinium_carterae.1